MPRSKPVIISITGIPAAVKQNQIKTILTVVEIPDYAYCSRLLWKIHPLLDSTTDPL
jgi:hypothetical protein